MVKGKIILFFLALFTWLFLSWPFDEQHLAVGLIVAAVVTFLSGDFFASRPGISKKPLSSLYFAVQYLVIFLWGCFKANIDIFFKVISPRLSLDSNIFEVKTRLKSALALTILANTLTLAQGTLSVDIDNEQGVLYIHSMGSKTKDGLEAIQKKVERLENIIDKIL